MSTTKTKEELTRLAWISALRREGHRKCLDFYEDYQGRVCALGLLCEVVGKSPGEMGTVSHIGALAGLDGHQATAITFMNDGRGPCREYSFSEIADEVERWFE
jgi:hypothetical protein